MRKET